MYLDWRSRCQSQIQARQPACLVICGSEKLDCGNTLEGADEKDQWKEHWNMAREEGGHNPAPQAPSASTLTSNFFP